MSGDSPKSKAPKMIATGAFLFVFAIFFGLIGGAVVGDNFNIGPGLVVVGIALLLGALGAALVVVGAAANAGSDSDNPS
jgi:hypothetical protein